MVEVSGSTPLTQRLVEAAAKAISKDTWRATRTQWAARDATVAVLRELARSAGDDYYNGGDFQDLADEIEKGE